MFEWLTKLSAAVKAPKGKTSGVLPVQDPPKVKPNQQSIPSYLKTAKPNDSVLPESDRRLATTNIEDYRGGQSTRQVIRDFSAASPDLSASISAFLRTAITPKYLAVARNLDGSFNRDATSLLQQLLVRFDVVQDYSDGFSSIQSLRSLSESLAKELLLYGSCCLELVLDKGRLPRQVSAVSVTQIKFIADQSGKWLRPIQKLGGVDVDLDLPTVFYVALDQSLLEAYSDSPLEAAIQPVQFSAELMNDLRRVVKRVIHPRMTVTIDEDKFRKNIPPEYAHDSEKLAGYMSSVISDIESKINGLRPEDALVLFSTLGVELLNNGNTTLDKEWTVLGGMTDAKMATGARTLPAILGHGAGTSTASSVDALLFMKNADGMVRAKLNEIYSRALTLAVRLFGLDVYVEFKYDAIDLRPDSELEAFKVMKQSRHLELLSLGFLTDDEAALALTGSLTPAGFKPLSGTGFMQPVKVDPNANPNSNTSNGKGNGPQDRNTNTPTQPKGPAKKAELELVPPLADVG